MPTGSPSVTWRIHMMNSLRIRLALPLFSFAPGLTIEYRRAGLFGCSRRSSKASCTPALLAPVSATASSLQAANTPPRTRSTRATTRWSSAFADPQWLYVDYGSTVVFNEVKITWQTAYSTNYDVQVSGSTNGPWTTVYTKPIQRRRRRHDESFRVRSLLARLHAHAQPSTATRSRRSRPMGARAA